MPKKYLFFFYSFSEKIFGWDGYDWIEIETIQTWGRDISQSTITAAAAWSQGTSTIELVLDYDHYDGSNWVDGFQFTFPDGFSSYVNSWDITSGNVCSHGSDQNCDNLDGTWYGDVLLYGNDNGSGLGAFEGDMTFTLNVNPWFTGDSESLNIGYVVYDDGLDGSDIDAEGTAEINTINELLLFVNNWKIKYCL